MHRAHRSLRRRSRMRLAAHKSRSRHPRRSRRSSAARKAGRTYRGRMLIEATGIKIGQQHIILESNSDKLYLFFTTNAQRDWFLYSVSFNKDDLNYLNIGRKFKFTKETNNTLTLEATTGALSEGRLDFYLRGNTYVMTIPENLKKAMRGTSDAIFKWFIQGKLNDINDITIFQR
jgi:hypothetical protein